MGLSLKWRGGGAERGLLKQKGKKQRLLEGVAFIPRPRLLGDAPQLSLDQQGRGVRRASMGREVISGDFEIMLVVPFSLHAVCRDS